MSRDRSLRLGLADFSLPWVGASNGQRGRSALRRNLAIAGAGALTAALLQEGCLGQGAPIPHRQTYDDGGATIIEAGVTESGTDEDVPTVDPHSVLGVDPSHGPFTGGQRALIRGTGFGGDLRVWFADNEVPHEEIVTVSPEQAQVSVPSGAAGPADVTAQNGDDESTRRTLENAYIYDGFYLTPSSGPTSGGTEVTLHGQSTGWDDSTEVFVDLVPCTSVEVTSATELSCTTPAGVTGSKAVRVRDGDGVDVDVLDAFTYVDTNDGYRGGLSGAPLSDHLTVIVLNNATGRVVPGASVVLGQDLETARTTGSDGIVHYGAGEVEPTPTVTVAMPCFQPITFVAVPVDTVTVYLDPVLSPLCIEGGDQPPVGGVSPSNATIEGQLVWESAVEFTRMGWTNVPPPTGPDEEYVAYVFRPTSDPKREFSLPDRSRAVTFETDGTVGYSFELSSSPGNLTLYALAGIENRQVDPPTFVAYAMGLTRGVITDSGQTTSEVFIPMNIPVDHAMTLDVAGPEPTPRGPDRIDIHLSLNLGEPGYAIFPMSFRSQLLPITSQVQFVGLPPLVGALVGTQYIITAEAVTGPAGLTPKSVIGQLSRGTSDGIVDVSGFVEVPVLLHPQSNDSWDGRSLAVEWAPGGRPVHLSVFEIQSGAGLVNWTVAAPADHTEIELPALRELDPELALMPGPINVVVSLAHIADFNYGVLRFYQLTTRGWLAHSRDTYPARLAE